MLFPNCPLQNASKLLFKPVWGLLANSLRERRKLCCLCIQHHGDGARALHQIAYPVFLSFLAAELEYITSISAFGRERDNALFWFSVLCCAITAYFHRYTLLASLIFRNLFCCKPYLNCSSFPNVKPSFQKFVLVDMVYSSTWIINCSSESLTLFRRIRHPVGRLLTL